MSDDKGLIANVLSTCNRIIGSLPPAFLMLVLMNLAFIGMVLWFLDDQLDQRTKLVNTLIERCLDIASKSH